MKIKLQHIWKINHRDEQKYEEEITEDLQQVLEHPL